LFDACVQASGDPAEAVAHLLPPPARADTIGLRDATAQLDALRAARDDAQVLERLLQCCESLDVASRERLLQLALGRWRRQVSDALLQDSLAAWAGIDPRVVRVRWRALVSARTPRLDALVAPALAAQHAHALPWPLAALERITSDGVDAVDAAACVVHAWHGGQPVQLVRRAAGCWLWSDSGELHDDGGAQVIAAASSLPPDTVLHGEWSGDDSRSVLRVHDVLQWAGRDVRDLGHVERWAMRSTIGSTGALQAAQVHPSTDLQSIVALHAGLRQQGLRGLLLLRRDMAYAAAGGMRLWAAPALTLHAVVQAVQWSESPSGRVGIELGLALWRQRVRGPQALERLPDPSDTDAVMGLWAPLAKVWLAGDATDLPAFDELTLQRFGPLRLLEPALVCEVHFDALQRNPRRRSGVTLTGAVFGGWRLEATLVDVDEVAALQAWLPAAHVNDADQGS
jgi:DNA ligase-1